MIENIGAYSQVDYERGYKQGRTDTIDNIVDMYNSNPDIDAFTLIRNLLKEKTMSEVRVVDLKELGVSKEVFDKIYSMGEQDGRADAIEEYANALINDGKVSAMRVLKIKEQLKCK